MESFFQFLTLRSHLRLISKKHKGEKKKPKTQRQTKWTQGTLEKALAKDQLEIR